MRVIASYILKSPVQAILAATVPAVVSIGAPFVLKLLLVYFSGIVIALVSLRLGAQKGIGILLITLFATLVAGQFFTLDTYAWLDLWNTVYMWALIWLAASVWYMSRSLPRVLEVTGLVAVLTVTVFFLVLDDPYQSSLNLLEPLSLALSQPGTGLSSQELEGFKTTLQLIATMLIGSVIGFTALGSLICLFIARSWQARLFNPGGWQQEFRAIRLSRLAGGITIAILLSFALVQGRSESAGMLLNNISVVIGLIYIVVGLGIVHATLALKNGPGYWLVGLYVLLIVFSQVAAPLLMALALTDIWVDYRARLAKKLS